MPPLPGDAQHPPLRNSAPLEPESQRRAALPGPFPLKELLTLALNPEPAWECKSESDKSAVMGKDKHPAEAEVKVATVDLEAVDNMATLPVGQHRQQGSDIAIAEKHNVANKEMELKCVQPKPSKKYVMIMIYIDGTKFPLIPLLIFI